MTKLRKLLAALLVAALAFSLTACMPTAAPATELSVASDKADPSPADYTDDLDGLVSYMKDCQLITGEGMEMSADFIGAARGQKFTFKHLDSNMTCELYEFDLENPNEKEQSTLESAKDTGKITVLEQEVEVQLSESDKFIMIFTSQKREEAQIPFIDRIGEKFASFKGGIEPEPSESE